jgi:hypothetical protein
MTIDKFYCINLLSRGDRWSESQAEFRRMGLAVEHFAATSGPNPHLAFNDSQYRAIKAGYDSGAECFVVFEDDCQFDAPWSKVEESMKDLPFGWDALYLGSNICTDWFQKPERVSDRLVRLRDAWQSHAVIYSRKGAENLLSKFNPNDFPIFDEWVRGTIMKEENIYMVAPMVCFQRCSYSNIWERETDYTGCHIHGNRILQMI